MQEAQRAFGGGRRDHGLTVAHGGDIAVSVHHSGGGVAAGPCDGHGLRVRHRHLCAERALCADAFQIHAGLVQSHAADVVLDRDRAGQRAAAVGGGIDGGGAS